MPDFSNVIIATVLNSLLGLIGVLSLYLDEKTLNKAVKIMVAFAAGAMLAGALAHLLPKALSSTEWAPEIAILGFSGFFILERYLHWHHCHRDESCDVHPVTALTIIGDGIHNFIDGLVIAAAFLVDNITGWMTTALIMGHELPQELGNFSVLVYGGYSKKKAILWTFIAQATCILGGIVGWFITPDWMKAPLLAFAAGGFLYISASDLVPELHKGKDLKKSTRHFLAFALGATFMIVIKLLVHH